MNSAQELNQAEYSEYAKWSCKHEEKLTIRYEAWLGGGERICIKAFEVRNDVIGLVDTSWDSRGWIAHGSNGLECIYDAIASHEDEYVRAIVANFGFCKDISLASYKVREPIPYRILKRLSRDESPIVRAAVAYSYLATREILNVLATDHEEIVRKAVACNPLTPPSSLDTLSSDESLVVLEGLATNTSAPLKALTRISEIDSHKLKKNLAGNPAASPEILWKLLNEAENNWDGWAIREMIATNQNAPQDLLLELARLHVGKVWINLAKNPNTPQEAIVMIAERTAGTIGCEPSWPGALLSNPLLPLSFYERFADTTSKYVRRLVRDSPRTPESLKLRLSYDPELSTGDRCHFDQKLPRLPETSEPMSLIEIYSLSQSSIDRAVAASAPNAPHSILRRLSVDYSPRVRAAVARNEYAGEELLLSLVNDDDERVRVAAASNPCMTENMLKRLSLDESDSVRMQLAKRADLPAAMLIGFARSDSPVFRGIAASNEALPYDEVKSLMDDASPWVRYRIASRDDISESDYEHLLNAELDYVFANDSNNDLIIWREHRDKILIALAEKAPLTEELQEKLIQFQNRDIRKKLAQRADITISIAMRLAKDRNGGVVTTLARNPNTPQAAIEMLTNNENEYVRRLAIQNPNIEEALLLKMAKCEEEWKRGSAASNPKLPKSVLGMLAKDGSDYVREMAASNPETSAEDLLRLANDQSEKVREGVARNKKTPLEVLSYLGEDESDNVTAALAARKDLPLAIVRKLTQKLTPRGISNLVFFNKQLDTEALETLEESGNSKVLERLAECEDTPASILKRLFEKGDDTIRAKLVHNPNMPPIMIRTETEHKTANEFESFNDDIPY